MKVTVEQHPAGGWVVRADGVDAPVARFDTEEEARERALAMSRGLAREAAVEADAALGHAPTAEVVPLRDGSEVLVREVLPEDKELFLAGIRRVGEEARYARFLWAHPPTLRPEELRYFTEVDHDDHEAIGAMDLTTGEGIGVARYIRDAPGSPSAEAAVTIIDDWQGRGLGTVLAQRLAERAEARGITQFVATLWATNRAMVHVFGHLGEMRESAVDAGVVELDITLPTHELPQRVKQVAEAHEAIRQATSEMQAVPPPTRPEFRNVRPFGGGAGPFLRRSWTFEARTSMEETGSAAPKEVPPCSRRTR